MKLLALDGLRTDHRIFLHKSLMQLDEGLVVNRRGEVITAMKMTTSVLGVVLAVAMFSAGTVIDRITNVYVTNFPLDNNGNLRTSVMNEPLNVNVTNMPAKELMQTYKEGVRTNLLDTKATGWSSQSVVFQLGTYQFPFTFNPKGTNQNITKLWLSLVYLQVMNLQFKLNGVSAGNAEIGRNESYSMFASIDIQESTLEQGINILTMTVVNGDTKLQELSIFIEYEYLA